MSSRSGRSWYLPYWGFLTSTAPRNGDPKSRFMEEGVRVPRNSLILVSFVLLFASLAFSSATDVLYHAERKRYRSLHHQPATSFIFQQFLQLGQRQHPDRTRNDGASMRHYDIGTCCPGKWNER